MHPNPSALASVVVCAYTLDRWDDLVRAIRSVHAQAGTWDREVLVVIDHNPELADRARHEIDGVRVLESTGPRGLSGARNAGVEAAAGSVVAFLDDDAAAEPGWLEALLAPYADPRVVGTGGHAEAAWDLGRPRWFPDEFDWVVGCSYRGLPRITAPVRNPLGCAMSFRADAIRDAGGFRTEVGRVGLVPTGGEETELSIRIAAARPGSRILSVPWARVRHRVTPARTTWGYFRSRCYQEGRSKAVISELRGSSSALASERAYLARTLPEGVLRNLAAVARGDVAGLGRAVAIVAGAAITAAGFVAGRSGLHRLGALEPGAAPTPAPDSPGS